MDGGDHQAGTEVRGQQLVVIRLMAVTWMALNYLLVELV